MYPGTYNCMLLITGACRPLLLFTIVINCMLRIVGVAFSSLSLFKRLIFKDNHTGRREREWEYLFLWCSTWDIDGHYMRHGCPGGYVKGNNRRGGRALLLMPLKYAIFMYRESFYFERQWFYTPGRGFIFSPHTIGNKQNHRVKKKLKKVGKIAWQIL